MELEVVFLGRLEVAAVTLAKGRQQVGEDEMPAGAAVVDVLLRIDDLARAMARPAATG